MPTHGFSIKPLKVKLLAGEQKAAETRRRSSGQKHRDTGKETNTTWRDGERQSGVRPWQRRNART